MCFQSEAAEKTKVQSATQVPEDGVRRFTFYISNPSLETPKLENKRYVNGFGLEKQHRDRFDFFLSVSASFDCRRTKISIFRAEVIFYSKKVFHRRLLKDFLGFLTFA